MDVTVNFFTKGHQGVKVYVPLHLMVNLCKQTLEILEYTYIHNIL